MSDIKIELTDGECIWLEYQAINAIEAIWDKQDQKALVENGYCTKRGDSDG